MSKETHGGTIGSPQSIVELHADLARVELGESPSEIADSYEARDKREKDQAEVKRSGNESRRRTNIAIKLINLFRKRAGYD